MKKVVYILIGTLTLFVGIIVYYARPLKMPVSLCEVTQNVELYHFNEIHIRGNLGVSKDGNSLGIFEIEKGCEDNGAELWLSEEYEEKLPREKLSEDLLNLITQLQEKSSQDRQAVVEVEIIGKISKREMACFSFPFVVKVKDIKQTSPIHFINQ